MDGDFVIATWNLDTCGKGKVSAIAKYIHDVVNTNEIDLLALQEVGFARSSRKLSCSEILEDLTRSLPQYSVACTEEYFVTANEGLMYLPILYNKRKLQVLQQETIPLQEKTSSLEEDELRFCVRYRIKILESNFVFDFINLQFSPTAPIATNQFTHLLHRFEDYALQEYPLVCAGDLNISAEQYPISFAAHCSSAGSARDHQIFVWKEYKTGKVHTTYEYELLESPIISGIPRQGYAIETGNRLSPHDCLLSRIVLQIE